MKTRRFKVLLEWDADDRVWVAIVPSLGNLAALGETKAAVLANVERAIADHLASAASAGNPVPADDCETELVDVEVAVA